MENEEKLMTGEDSLRVITDMINKTRVSIAQASFHLLLWGWLIFACSLSEFLLWKYAGWVNSWYVWFAVIAGSVVSFIYGIVKGKQERVYTYGTTIYVWTWIAFFIASVVFFIIHSPGTASVGKYMLLIAAIPLLISGVILKFRPLMWGAVAFWILALVAHFGGDTISGFTMPVAMVSGYLIPGYLLKRRGSHDTVPGA